MISRLIYPTAPTSTACRPSIAGERMSPKPLQSCRILFARRSSSRRPPPNPLREQLTPAPWKRSTTATGARLLSSSKKRLTFSLKRALWTTFRYTANVGFRTFPISFSAERCLRSVTTLSAVEEWKTSGRLLADLPSAKKQSGLARYKRKRLLKFRLAERFLQGPLPTATAELERRIDSVSEQISNLQDATRSLEEPDRDSFASVLHPPRRRTGANRRSKYRRTQASRSVGRGPPTAFA